MLDLVMIISCHGGRRKVENSCLGLAPKDIDELELHWSLARSFDQRTDTFKLGVLFEVERPGPEVEEPSGGGSKEISPRVEKEGLEEEPVVQTVTFPIPVWKC